ncbi:VWA domain-containing protein [Halioglobus maricola]|uniref:VWA domain-containing protein n=1 Tax=Halioglobus maricola TaxID=2601894 RepID=A0A5P9NLL2_9GAMM|nr:VWA domain-containing protein [Halioglobus maricola]QFU76395.1 VWA domain-containing protein [Halioglobus maricola]
MIELLWPWLLLLAPLPLLVRALLPPASGQEPALRAPFFSSWEALSKGSGKRRGGPGAITLVLVWLIWALLLLAASRPMWIGDAIELPNSGRDLMMAVDISGSMETDDMEVSGNRVSRWEAVRQLGANFIDQRRGDRLGLILFGSNAYVQSPLSFDGATVKRFLLEARIGFAGQETAIGDAIGLAVKRLKERPAENRVLILLSDGEDTASSVQPLQAARLAADLGIRIYTIGIGADKMTVPGLFGSSFGSRQVNPSRGLDEATLGEIAQLTGGRYFRARNPADLANIYAAVDELEPIEVESASYRPRQALAYLPLGAALALSFLLALTRVWRHFGWRSHPLEESA